MARSFTAASSQSLDCLTAAVSGMPLTVACWFKVPNITASYTLVTVGVDGSTNNFFRLRVLGSVAGDPVEAEIRDTGNNSARTSTGYTANVWHHACAVYTSSTSRSAYLNGGGKITNTDPRTPSGFDCTLIARAANGTGFLEGIVAEPAIWSVTLSDAEVLALANGVHPSRIRPDAIVGGWHLYGVDSPEPDYSGHGLNFTLINAPTQADHCRVQQPWGYDLGYQGNFGTGAPPPTIQPWFHYAAQMGA